MELPISRQLSREDYSFAVSRGYLSEALGTASLLTEIEVSAGNLPEAREWFNETNRLLSGLDAHKIVPHSGYLSNSTMMALLESRYEDAERILDYALENIPRLNTPRFRPYCDSMRMRARIMRGDTPEPELIQNLTSLFERSRSFCNQDTVAEVLWSAILLTDGADSASRFLEDYLKNHRRETGPPEWMLRHTTAADEVWLTYDQYPALSRSVSRRRRKL